jgi:hypothetical protein
MIKINHNFSPNHENSTVLTVVMNSFIIGDSGMLSKTKYRNKKYLNKKSILTNSIVVFTVFKLKLNELNLVYICFLNKMYLH